MEEPTPDQCYTIGTAATVQRLLRLPDGTIRLLVLGLERIRITEYTTTAPYLKAKVEPAPEASESTVETEALRRNIGAMFGRLVELVPGLPDEIAAVALNIEDPRQLAYAIATYMRIDLQDAQEILELDDATSKLRKVTALLSKELEVLELGRKIQTEAHSEMEKVQREYFLREQLKAIQKELGERDEQQIEVEELRKKIEAAGMPEEAYKEAKRELDRLAKLPTAAAEYGVIRTYLDWLTSLPWNKITPDNLDIPHARVVLDEDHYGLKDIKERILEYLAVRKLKTERAARDTEEEKQAEEAELHDYIRREREGVILCFVGPPGVGKTSLGQSIARAMGRKFIRQSLGGVRDEAEIRGFRRTYIGSMPGRIIQALRRIETRNPIFMLDEVDKLTADFRGDPSSALLEVLDPGAEPRVPRSLSGRAVRSLAGDLHLHGQLPGSDPRPAARSHGSDSTVGLHRSGKDRHRAGLLDSAPDQRERPASRRSEIHRRGADADHSRLHARSRRAQSRAGDRSGVPQAGDARSPKARRRRSRSIRPDVVGYLGKPRFYGEIAERTQMPGVATGLAWTPVGGDIMFIEATQMPGGRGFQLTGPAGRCDARERAGGAVLRAFAGRSVGRDARVLRQARSFTCTSRRARCPRTAHRRA